MIDAMKQASIKLTVLFDGMFWVGVFEVFTATSYSVGKTIFGNEPTEPIVYDFISNEYFNIKFTTPKKDDVVIAKKINPKRLQREAKKEISNNNMSKAQDALRIELEKNKKLRKVDSKKEREENERVRYELKQAKKKKKLRGH